MRHVAIIFSLFITLSVNAQYVCGHVIDSDSGRPLTGVVVSIPELDVFTENDSIRVLDLRGKQMSHFSEKSYIFIFFGCAGNNPSRRA
jgi:hypothetical protein